MERCRISVGLSVRMRGIRTRLCLLETARQMFKGYLASCAYRCDKAVILTWRVVR